MSPYVLVNKEIPKYFFLRVFDCLCFPYLRPYNKHKIEFRYAPIEPQEVVAIAEPLAKKGDLKKIKMKLMKL